jgi:hypothetical protein
LTAQQDSASSGAVPLIWNETKGREGRERRENGITHLDRQTNHLRWYVLKDKDVIYICGGERWDVPLERFLRRPMPSLGAWKRSRRSAWKGRGWRKSACGRLDIIERNAYLSLQEGALLGAVTIGRS